jgi:hypothetical protein
MIKLIIVFIFLVVIALVMLPRESKNERAWKNNKREELELLGGTKKQ